MIDESHEMKATSHNKSSDALNSQNFDLINYVFKMLADYSG